MNRLNEPPDAPAVRAALHRLPAMTALRVAALHLATAMDVVPGIGASYRTGMYTVRGHTLRESRDDVDAVVRAVVGVARQAHQPGDRYLDLSSDPAQWVKVLRSGFRRVAFGAELLHGAPVTTVEDGVADVSVYRWLSTWSRGQVTEFPAVLPADPLTPGSQPVIVDGSRARVVLRGAVAGTLADLPVTSMTDLGRRAAQTADRLRTSLGGLRADYAITGSRFPGTIEYRCDVVLDDAWSAVVPFTLAAGTEMVGVLAHDVASTPAVPRDMPDGFEPVGMPCDEAGLVARHTGTGLLVTLRHADDSR